MPSPQHHPTEAKLMLCVFGRIDKSEADEIASHAADCRECRRKLEAMGAALSELREEFEDPDLAPEWRTEEHTVAPKMIAVVFNWTTKIAAALILAAFGVWYFVRPHPNYVAEVSDSTGKFRLRDTGRLEAPLTLPEDWKTRVASVLAGKGIPELAAVSPQLDALRAKSATLAAPPLDLEKLTALRPVNSAVATNRPLFQWTAPSGATSFVVTIRNDSGFKWQTGVTNATKLVLPVTAPELADGQTFTWSVETTVGRTLSISSPAWFFVLDSKTAAELHRREQEFAKSPLALGTLYAAHGLLDEAEVQFDRVRNLNTNHPVAMVVLDQLARRRGRTP